MVISITQTTCTVERQLCTSTQQRLIKYFLSEIQPEMNNPQCQKNWCTTNEPSLQMKKIVQETKKRLTEREKSCFQ